MNKKVFAIIALTMLTIISYIITGMNFYRMIVFKETVNIFKIFIFAALAAYCPRVMEKIS